MFVWDAKEMGIECHEASQIVPMMEEPEYESLKRSIDIAGQNEVCIIWRGKLLDGRNRWRACKELKKKPHAEHWPDNDPSIKWGKFDPWAYVDQQNVRRRHLSPSQRAVAAVSVWMGQQPHKKKLTVKAAKALAGEYAVSQRMIQSAAKLKRLAVHEPRLAEVERNVATGKTKLSAVPEVSPLGERAVERAAEKRLAQLDRRAAQKRDHQASRANLQTPNPLMIAWRDATTSQRREFAAYVVGQADFRAACKPTKSQIESHIKAQGTPWALEPSMYAADFAAIIEQDGILDWRTHLCEWLKQQTVTAA